MTDKASWIRQLIAEVFQVVSKGSTPTPAYRQWWVDYFVLHGYTRKLAEAKVAARWPVSDYRAESGA